MIIECTGKGSLLIKVAHRNQLAASHFGFLGHFGGSSQLQSQNATHTGGTKLGLN